MKKNIRLIVLSHKLFYRTINGLQTDGAFTLQMDALANHVDELILCVPIQESSSFQGIGVTSPAIRFHSLPPFSGRRSFLRLYSELRREIIMAVSNADFGLVILPGYFGTMASIICQRRQFPIFQWVVGDWRQNVTSRQTGRLSKLWTPALDWITKRTTRDVLTFFNGSFLYPPPPAHHHLRTSSSIRLADLYERKEINLSPPHQLLYVGRLSAEKGIIYLLKAASILKDNGFSIFLHIVGRGALQEILKAEIERLSLQTSVQLHGFIPFGEELHNLYRQADIFILPAQQDQQPKVLMESMSQSVPIIATNVGGIPAVICDGENGLLIPAANPDAIATAVTRLLSDISLRHRLIENGLLYARTRTVDVETAKMMEIVGDYFNCNKSAL